MKQSTEIDYGRRGEFHWLWSARVGVATLIEACPGILHGRPVLVTDYEGAPPTPTSEQEALGWQSLHGCAFNPSLPEPRHLIWSDICEVFVFKDACEPKFRPPDLNDGTLTLRDPKAAIPYQHTWDRRGIGERREALRVRQRAFWDTLTELDVESYFGTDKIVGLNFATSRQENFEALLEALRLKRSF